SLPPYFLFDATATTQLYTLSLHDALPISTAPPGPGTPPPSAPGTGATTARLARWHPLPNRAPPWSCRRRRAAPPPTARRWCATRSEEHTSELQSRRDLVCRLLLEKKKHRNKRGTRNPKQSPTKTDHGSPSVKRCIGLSG